MTNAYTREGTNKSSLNQRAKKALEANQKRKKAEET